MRDDLAAALSRKIKAVRFTHPALLALIGGKLSPKQLNVEGDRASLGRFFSLLETPDRGFAIVTP